MTNGTKSNETKRSLVPRLPREAWVVLGGDMVSAIGTGLTLPFLLVYYSRVRGIDIGVAGFAVSMIGFASLVGNPTGGALADRIGPRKALILGTIVSAVGAVGIAFVRDPWHAFAAAAAVGFGAAVAWPARDAFLAVAVTPEQRSSVFGVRHASFNAGLGIGGLVAAMIVDLSSAATFERIFIADAVTFVAFAVLLFFIRDPRGGQEAVPSDVTRGSYFRLFRDRVFIRIWVLSAVLITVGYGQFTAFFPAYVTGEGGLSAGSLAVIVAANTITVVLAQLVTLRVMEGHRRTRGIALMAVLWAATWVITLATGRLLSGGAAVAVFAVAMIVFAVGETLLSPTIPPLVNDLAPDDARGRYNGATTLAWTTGFILGPILAGLFLEAGRAGVLVAVLVGGCAVAAALAWDLERHLEAKVNLVPVAEAEPVPVASPPEPI